MGAHDRAIEYGQRALALLPRPAGMSSSRCWRTSTLARPTSHGRLSAGGRLLQTERGALEASCSASASGSRRACRDLPCLVWRGALPSSGSSPRAGPGGEGLQIAEAVAPLQPYASACCGSACCPPPGGPRQGIPLLERALASVRPADLTTFLPRRRLGLGLRRMPWPGALPRPCRCWSRRWNRPPPWGVVVHSVLWRHPAGRGASAGRRSRRPCTRRACADALARQHQERGHEA